MMAGTLIAGTPSCAGISATGSLGEGADSGAGAAPAPAAASAAAPTQAIMHARARRYSGTVTHVPPEVFAPTRGALKSQVVDAAVDLYAFGILMWEVATGQAVYGTLPSEIIADNVAEGRLRPTFEPVGARPDQPHEYAEFKALAERCWDADPRVRPSAEECVQRLNGMLGSMLARGGAPASGLIRRRSTLSLSFTAGSSPFAAPGGVPPGAAGAGQAGAGFMPGPAAAGGPFVGGGSPPAVWGRPGVWGGAGVGSGIIGYSPNNVVQIPRATKYNQEHGGFPLHIL